MKQYSLKFYADRRPDYLNKLFVFESDSLVYLQCEIYKFVNLGNDIRALWITDYIAERNIKFNSVEIQQIVNDITNLFVKQDYQVYQFLKDFHITHRERLAYMSSLGNSSGTSFTKKRF